MRRISTIALLICVLGNSYGYNKLVIESNPHNNDAKKQYLSLNAKKGETIWFLEDPNVIERESGIKKEKTVALSCHTSSPYILLNTVNIAIDCNDNENQIRAQVNVNCDQNNSFEKAQYLFFGKVGVPFAHKNFYFYCQ